MYILIAIVFIAELIIALTLILLIVKADRYVCALNDCVQAFNPLAQTWLQYARCLVSSFNKSFNKVYKFFKKKQEQVLFRIVLILSIYAILIVFRIKTKKVSKIYGLIGAIRDAATELMI